MSAYKNDRWKPKMSRASVLFVWTLSVSNDRVSTVKHGTIETERVRPNGKVRNRIPWNVSSGIFMNIHFMEALMSACWILQHWRYLFLSYLGNMRILVQARNPLPWVAHLGARCGCRQPDLALPSAPRMPHTRFRTDRPKSVDLYREQTDTHTHTYKLSFIK